MKKERPILFSTPMVQAILDGRKTQTRRIAKHQHWSFSELIDVNQNRIVQKTDRNVSCPYGDVGDVLWVRETWFSTRFDCNELLDCGITNHLRFKADNSYDPKKDCVGRKWKPSIHMPKAAARIWLEITAVRVERLHDISEDDAKAEGVDNWTWKNVATPQNWMCYSDPKSPPLCSAYDSFLSLWESINGEESLDANPWVWVIQFKRIK